MTDEIAAANKTLLRRFYKEGYVNWNMALVDEVVSQVHVLRLARRRPNGSAGVPRLLLSHTVCVAGRPI
jgi:hypothetical protein